MSSVDTSRADVSVDATPIVGFRLSVCAAAIFLCVLLATVCAFGRVHRSQSWAVEQFNKAEAQHETLNGRADQSRTQREYETVIASYRRIVLEAPTSSKADGSAFAVAQLTAEMGRHFKDQMALYSAVREYKFFRREYPGSRHRIEALLAIGEIYKNDLGDDADGRVAFEELVRRYPHSELVKEAQAELATSGRDASAKNASAEADNSNSSDHEETSENAVQPSPQRAKSADASEAGKSEKPVRVKNVQYWSRPDYTRIAIDLEQDVRFQSQRIDNPDRVFFDLKNARLASSLSGQSLDVSDGLVKKVRIAQYKSNLARIVVETEGRANYNASLVLNPPRIVIDIHGDAARPVPQEDQPKANSPPDNSASINAAPTVQEASEKTSEATAALPGVPKSPKKVVVEADANDDDSPTDSQTQVSDNAPAAETPAKPVRSNTRNRSTKTTLSASTKSLREAQPTSDGDRSLIRALGLKIGKIVIDPGHGGHDTGTIGPNGLYEKDLVLDVSKRLGKLLESRLGADVVFTRRDDTFIPLETRTSIANQEEADLFVSVHANSSHDPDARGVETYYLNFTSSPEALDVAARENAASDKSIHELQDLVKKIALKEKIEESREFASDVQQSLHSGLAAKSSGVRDRGVKKAPFVVLIGANMPSILAEISFISNPGDEKRLRSADYRQRIAESLYRGISRYVNGLGGVKVASRIEKTSAN